MNDEQTIQTGAKLFDKTLEALEELINALLSLPANNREQFHILQKFADYAREGGELRAIQFDSVGLEDFHKAAKEHNLTYYAVVNESVSEATVIIKDCDLKDLDEVLEACPYLPPRKLSMDDVKEVIEKNQRAAEEQKKSKEVPHGKDTENGRSK